MQKFDFKKIVTFFENRKLSIHALICFSIIFCLAALLFGGAYYLDRFLYSDSQTESETKTEQEEKIYSDKEEIRGIYVASVFNLNFPKASGKTADDLASELDQIVSECVSTGFNTIYFQVRPSADALYQSAIFPTSRFLVSKEGDPLPLDPLAYLVEKAKEKDISVVAWVNPYRVSTTSFESKEEALASLSETNPAKQHPDWTFFYDGKLFFDPGVPKVRDLIVSGVKEICSSYGVKGILYDDYFYPSPVNGKALEDQTTYENSGSTLSVEDWRRENVNRMVEESYRAVKAVSKDLSFGVSPFGIWQNASSHEKGSQTSGMEAYSSLYCDALAWMEGGYVDYISPQLYWERQNPVASFDVLARWWNEKCKETGVKLIISHGAYKSGQFAAGGEEIADQIEEARGYSAYCGNIQYGFADIVNNSSGVKDAIVQVFSQQKEEKTQ